MDLRRPSLLIGIVFFLVFGSLRLRSNLAEANATISGRELLDRVQHASASNYTFKSATSAALDEARIPAPPKDAGQAELESALRSAGFALRPLPIPGKKVFVVEPAGG